MARRTGIGSQKSRSTARLGVAPTKRTSPARSSAPGRINWSKAAAVILVLGSLGLVYQLFAAQRFTVQQVVVQGNDLVSVSDIEGASEVLGGSIFHVHPGRVAQALKERYGCIAQATVRTRLPNQVIVSMQEHQELVVWESGGAAWWITPEGQSLGPAYRIGDLPVIHDLRGHESAPQGFVVGVPWPLLSELIKRLPDARRFDYTREHGVIMYVTQDQWPVYLGSRGDARLKLAIMTSVVEHLQQEGLSAEYIDLRSEREPTFKAHQADR